MCFNVVPLIETSKDELALEMLAKAYLTLTLLLGIALGIDME